MPHKHSILYDNCLSSWDEALPLGNGHFGGMVYLSNDELVIAVNHYDVYYRILPMYGARARARGNDRKRSYASSFEELKERALAARRDPESPAHNNYNLAFTPERSDIYGVDRKGNAQPLTAELRLRFLPGALPLRRFRQLLDIGNGTYNLTEPRFSLKAYFSDEDLLVVSLAERGEPVLASVELTVPPRRLIRREESYSARGDGGEAMLSLESRFHSWGDEPAKDEPFSYHFAARVAGAPGTPRSGQAKSSYLLAPGRKAAEIVVLAKTVFDEGIDGAEVLLRNAAGRLDGLERAQEAKWASFWSRSSISLPDAFLEQLWHVNLYALACSNGEGARLSEQACGLNGLWDIVQPSQWGSAWYWDVNIEQSFWPIYTSNHLELGEAFYRGLLSHVPEAERHARDFYGLSGIAGDYPFTLYLAIWPWCCQYFAWQYAYSGDREFLRKRAYPLFVKVLEFFEQYVSWEEESQLFVVFPDVSPEQGPVTRNSTITVSCLRYLLAVAIDASRLLGVDPEKREKWEHILAHLPPYAVEDSKRYGRHIKDSEWAEPDTYMAHSSPLMPIYPIGELTPRSADPGMLANTLDYMEREQNLGTHNFGWLACAWARVGQGDQVLRMLYHLGVAYQLRPNGLFAEETERWMQNCLTACEPVYSPPLVEAGSATAAAVSEMLLQSHGGLIRIFPALPTGTLDLEADRKFDQVMGSRARTFPAWSDCSFDRLLAEGAFEVSATRERGVLTRCLVKSLRGNPARLESPFARVVVLEEGSGRAVGHTLEGGVISFSTTPGVVYAVRDASSGTLPLSRPAPAETAEPSVKIVKAPTSRRVSLGKSPQTELYRALDGATFDYFAGDQRVSPIALHRFDFSEEALTRAKGYASVLDKQFHGCGKMGLDFKTVAAGTRLTSTLGWGWVEGASLEHVDRGEPDALRRDFVGSSSPAAFGVELSAGSYRITAVTGDWRGESFTTLAVGSTRWSTGRPLEAGEFAYPVLSVDHPGGLLVVRIQGGAGRRWALNAMIVNRAL